MLTYADMRVSALADATREKIRLLERAKRASEEREVLADKTDVCCRMLTYAGV
jgi:hypothetical protein